MVNNDAERALWQQFKELSQKAYALANVILTNKMQFKRKTQPTDKHFVMNYKHIWTICLQM
jgi:hypothetical protein